MKNRYLQKIFLLLFFLSIYSCENSVESNYDKYYGEWIWQKTEGGIFPRIIKPEEGVTVIISFDIFGNYRVIRNDTLKLIAQYSIAKTDHDFDKVTFSNIITNSNGYIDTIQYAKISENLLEIWDGAIDGFFSTYIKR